MKPRNLTYDEAVSLLPEGDYIHTFRGDGVLLGADWSRADILTAMGESPVLPVAGDMARSMGHGLVLWTHLNAEKTRGKALFVATDEDRLSALDPLPVEAQA